MRRRAVKHTVWNAGLPGRARRAARQQRTRLARTRTTHPLDIRGWVGGKLPEEIYAELVQRIDNLDEVIKPYRTRLLLAGHALVEQPLRAWGLTGAIPQVPEHAEGPIVRIGAAGIVSDYWDAHPYQAGLFLPPILIIGPPWETPPNMVHILDLDPKLVRIAVTKSRELEQLDRVAETPSLALQRLFGAALGLIRRLGPPAVFTPLVQLALFVFLTGAHQAPSKVHAERAADAAGALLREFLPDLSRQLTRTPDRLAEMREAFQQTYAQATRIREEFDTAGVTPRLLARARGLLGRRTRPGELARWLRMTAHAMAVEAFAVRHHLSAKAVRDQLRLAEKAADIGGAWGEFVKFLAARPNAEQQRILATLLPPALPPTPPSAARSAE